MEVLFTEENIIETAKSILSEVTSKMLCFYGPMGAGKTTLIKALVQELGGKDTVSSPTFSIVNEYHKTDGELLAYHFDFYRLKDEMEVFDIGFEEYLNKGVWVFMEWPEKIKSFLPENATAIYLEAVDEKTRKLLLK